MINVSFVLYSAPVGAKLDVLRAVLVLSMNCASRNRHHLNSNGIKSGELLLTNLHSNRQTSDMKTSRVVASW